MKISKISALLAMLLVSSVALAEGGGDRTFAKMMQANDKAMAKYTAKEKKGESASPETKKNEAAEKK